MIATSPATMAYRAEMSRLVSGLLARQIVATRLLWDRGYPIRSAAQLAALSADWIAGAQLAAAELTRLWLALRTAELYGWPLSAVAPYAIPAGLIGSTAAGLPIGELAGMAPAVYWSRLLGGASPEDAAAYSAAWLGRLASSEPYRVANAVTLGNAERDPRMSGRYWRVTRSGACSFCALIADRGYTEARAGFAAHHNCKCTAEPEIHHWIASRR